MPQISSQFSLNYLNILLSATSIYVLYTHWQFIQRCAIYSLDSPFCKQQNIHWTENHTENARCHRMTVNLTHTVICQVKGLFLLSFLITLFFPVSPATVWLNPAAFSRFNLIHMTLLWFPTHPPSILCFFPPLTFPLSWPQRPFNIISITSQLQFMYTPS